MTLSRRSVLTCGGAALVGSSLGGCLSEPNESDPNGSDGTSKGYAAFFALWDWAKHVSGEEMGFENPIEAGEMGHGWEPPADIQREIADSDVFIYLDTAEFSWAQTIASDLEMDYDDVTVIDGMADLENELLPIDRETDDDREPATDYDFDPDSVSIGGFDVYDGQSGEEVAYWHGDHWHGSLPPIPLDGYATVEGVFEDGDERVLPLGEDEQFRIDARIVDGANEDVVEITSRGDRVELHGLETGRTRIVFELVGDGDVVWDTSDDNITTETVEELDESTAPEFYDPHVWVDPVIAQDIVRTIADGLADVDPDNATVYEEHAATYTDRLADVDRQFEELVEEASRDVAVLAGHDSFQYIEHRYEFDIHTPVGISPDAAETESDISETIRVVDEHGIDTILYDPFETPNPDEDVPQMVELLLEGTDAEEYAPLTPAEGTTAEWNEQNWGWVEQMEEINIPSLRRALGARE
ncbi:zinc ABC transporter substrate-binding protein [Natrarchaeobius halalkaliphilus]|uniref:Zinc ABC transporter substrate-binding protein n=1 Tax=Natrarchaeobius halalkaliphilus TaxID=1679091 RepID=A0A3N6MXK3_9EURY|nr:metal ABC transporter substrate-binding protein [Natrarchaeobius halalkaliphilus]RQG90242.1 zinc ABC transporter substrate-binding protein [Natrarchaeobius halalkaliphilus]